MTSSFVDQFPKYLRKHKVIFTGVVCIVMVLMGIPLTTRVCVLCCHFKAHSVAEFEPGFCEVEFYFKKK